MLFDLRCKYCGRNAEEAGVLRSLCPRGGKPTIECVDVFTCRALLWERYSHAQSRCLCPEEIWEY